jgi:hypothetical protein
MRKSCLAVSVGLLIAILWLWSHCVGSRAMPEATPTNTLIVNSHAIKEITHTTTGDFQAGTADSVSITTDNGGEIASAFVAGPFVPGTSALSWVPRKGSKPA